MTSISSIVEGHGEVATLPVLLRRIASWRCPGTYIDVQPPIRVHRDRFLNREDEFSRHLQLAGGKCGNDGWILILLDADDDCLAALGRDILARAQHGSTEPRYFHRTCEPRIRSVVYWCSTIVERPARIGCYRRRFERRSRSTARRQGLASSAYDQRYIWRNDWSARVRSENGLTRSVGPVPFISQTVRRVGQTTVSNGHTCRMSQADSDAQLDR